MHATALEVAFGAMRVDILQYLFNLAPAFFMQQLGMTPATAYMKLAPLASAGLKVSRRPTEAHLLCEVIQWMCEVGVMTDALLANSCIADAGTQVSLVHAVNDEGIKAVILAWLALPDNERVERTRNLLFPIIGPDRILTMNIAQTMEG